MNSHEFLLLCVCAIISVRDFLYKNPVFHLVLSPSFLKSDFPLFLWLWYIGNCISALCNILYSMFLWLFLGAKPKLCIWGSAFSRKGYVLLSASQQVANDFPCPFAGEDFFLIRELSSASHLLMVKLLCFSVKFGFVECRNALKILKNLFLHQSFNLPIFFLLMSE